MYVHTVISLQHPHRQWKSQQYDYQLKQIKHFKYLSIKIYNLKRQYGSITATKCYTKLFV